MRILLITTILTVISGCIFSQESPQPTKQTEQSSSGDTFPNEPLPDSSSINNPPDQQVPSTPVQPSPGDTFPNEPLPDSSSMNNPPDQQASSTPAQQPSSGDTFPNEPLPDSSSMNNAPDQQSPSTPAQPSTVVPTAIVLPREPEPVADDALIIPEASPEELKDSGINTLSLANPQGNWLFKRIWWERAEERYEKIRTLVDAVWESRTTFFVKRNELDRNILEPFYLNIGIGQGELQVILGELIEFLEKKRDQQNGLTEQEHMLYEVIVTEEDALKQLQVDIESVTSLDRAIDEALGTLMNQINRVRQYEEQAWQNFREIARILDDTKARELYYMIEGTARNIKNISNYIEQDFLKHFTTLINETTKHITRIQNQIKSLKEKGVSFKRQSELLKVEEQTPQTDQDDESEEKAAKPKRPVGWFGWISSGVTNFFNIIFSFIRMPYDLIFGK